MRTVQLLTIAASLASNVLAYPTDIAGRSTCENPRLRVEWREMDPVDQQSYLDSVLCLKTKPSRIGLTGTLYDDFPYVHFNLSSQIHGCAAFLPWHRYFSYVYEQALRDDCGYTGPMTYWDWTRDVLNLLGSPVMASTLGFGGNGSSSRQETMVDGRVRNCVDDGPFRELRPAFLAVSPKEIRTADHCFFRDVIDGPDNRDAVLMAQGYNATNIAQISQLAQFHQFAPALEGSPHGVIHASLGGEMNPTTSPNEPLFFLHHPQIDAIWWRWQQQDPSVRLTDFAGTKNTPGGAIADEPASLDDVLLMNGLAPDITVREIMDTTDARWCYKY